VRIERAAAQAVITAIAEGLTLQLGQAPTVLNAPPSQKAQYPAIAILIDDTEDDINQDDQDVEFDPTKQIGDEGFELTGFFRTDPDTNDYVAGQTYMLDADTTLSMIGVAHLRGRVWAATRLEPQREQLQSEIKQVFYSDRAAPGRLMVSVAGVEINGVRVPFGVATAMLEDKTKWVGEYAFAERLWAFMPISIDVPIMVPRNDPIAKQIILVVSQDLATRVSSPADLDKLADAAQYSIGSDGAVTGSQ
jgi:hypothetical protein